MPDFLSPRQSRYAFSIELIWFMAVFGLAITSPLALLVARDKVLQRVWKRTARQLDLTFTPGPLIGGDWMEGRISGYRVVISSELRRATRVMIDATSAIPEEIQLSLKAWGFVRADESLVTGDDDFDRTVFASGPIAELLARLDAETRAVVRELVTSPPGRFTAQIEVAGGWIVYQAPGAVLKLRNLMCIVFSLVRLADALRLKAPLQVALHDNACSPLEATAVRLKNLRVLIEQFPDSIETKEACRTALWTRIWPLRLMAAEHLDRTPEGINTLLMIVRSDDAPPRSRVRALRRLIGLAGRLPPDQDVLALSKTSVAEVRAGAVEVLGMRRTEEAIARLFEMTRDPRYEVVERVAAHLATMPGPATERALVGLLMHDAIEVRRAAARALESVGTVRAVEPLLASTRGVLADIELKAIARRTISRIQGRLRGAEAGHLSIAASDGGGLSLEEG